MHTHIHALALMLKPNGAVLAVSSADNRADRNFRLPGGAATGAQPTWEAMVQAVEVQTGLTVPPIRLVMTDLIPGDQRTGSPTRIDFVYRVPTLAEDVRIRLPRPVDGRRAALAAYKWLGQDELDDYCTAYQARRIRVALRAARTGTFAELHAGQPACAAAA